MSGLIIRGVSVPIPGQRVINWTDEPRIRLDRRDGRLRRTPWVRQIILHTTKGIPGGTDKRPQLIMPGRGKPADAGVRVAECWSRDPKQSGAHIVVDHDGTIYCLADIVREVTYHATVVNEWSVGIEIYQGAQAEMFEYQLGSALCDLCDVLTVALGIQRQIPHAYKGGPLRRLEEGGRDVVGIFGHRDVTSNRGLGDPGDAAFEALARRKYERLDFATMRDVVVWQERQQTIGLRPDGVPGPSTVAALAARGYTGGLWALPPAEMIS